MHRKAVLLAVALFATATSLFVPTYMERAEADSPGPRQVAVVVADRDAVFASEESTNLFRSLFGLLTTLRSQDRMAYVPMQEPSKVLGPVGGREVDLPLMINDIERILRTEPVDPAALGDAMIEAHSLLGKERALPGSDIYMMLGPATQAEINKQRSRLVPLVPRFRDKGWRINGLITPETTNRVKQFLNDIAQGGGGQVFELSVDGGLGELGQAILRNDAKGTLTSIGGRQLELTELMTSIVSIAPGTEDTTILIFKKSPFGSLRISNPDGMESSAGDRLSSQVIETPYVVAWKLSDPAPGTWKIDIRGMEGLVSVWEHSTNKYGLMLTNTSPIPTDQSATISAYVTDRGQMVPLDDVRLFANVTIPEGATIVYEMHDDGLNGDAVEGDGYFSAAIGPLHAIGDYVTELEMSWLEYDHTITSRSTFTAKAYPTIEIDSVQLENIVPGERTKVATVFIHIQGEPYAIPTQQLKAALGTPFEQGRQSAVTHGTVAQGATGQALPVPASTPNGLGTIELEPQRLFGEGPAWEYDVFYTPKNEGIHNLVFELHMEYAGVLYSYGSDSLTLRSLVPVVAVEPIVAEAPTTVVTSPEITQPKPISMGDSSDLLWPIVILLAILALAITIGLAYLLTRSRPKGYLYNDRDEPVVDFSNIKRRTMPALFLKNMVKGTEINVPEMNGLIFTFSRSGVKVRNTDEQQTVRINNQPLVTQLAIHDRTWIGISGKLFTFMLSPMASPDPASAD